MARNVKLCYTVRSGLTQADVERVAFCVNLALCTACAAPPPVRSRAGVVFVIKVTLRYSRNNVLVKRLFNVYLTLIKRRSNVILTKPNLNVILTLF